MGGSELIKNTDGFWQRNLKLWDISAGVLMVMEAGGKITLPNGRQWKVNNQDILASNNLIHQQILDELNKK